MNLMKRNHIAIVIAIVIIIIGLAATINALAVADTAIEFHASGAEWLLIEINNYNEIANYNGVFEDGSFIYQWGKVIVSGCNPSGICN